MIITHMSADEITKAFDHKYVCVCLLLACRTKHTVQSEYLTIHRLQRIERTHHYEHVKHFEIDSSIFLRAICG